MLASRVHHSKDILLILKPDTLLHWHRQGFRLFWKFKSRTRGGRPRISTETIALIQRMANENIFLFFRQIHLFFIVELASRRIIHFGITAHPTNAWIAQQLREATPYGQTPRFLIRDRDRKYGQAFARVAKDSSIEILKTPYRAPKSNAICERFLGSVRRECLDQMMILGEWHLYWVIKEYVRFFNQARPYQGIEQRIPEGTMWRESQQGTGKIIAFPVWGLTNPLPRTMTLNEYSIKRGGRQLAPDQTAV